ncbi:MAG TPA: class I SAM-dependent methyltransferase [Kofleriaceae bacterium]
MTSPRKTAPKAFRQAHTLAFAPLFFQAAMAARNTGVLDAVRAAKRAGITPADVARNAGVSLYAARVMLEGCLAVELVELVDHLTYTLSDAGYLWLTDDMTRTNANFVQDVCYAGAAQFETSAREGRPAGLSVFGAWPTIYAGLTELPSHVQDSWFAFDHFFSDRAFPLAFDRLFGRVFATHPKRLLDVGGNTGKWAVHCLTRDPQVEVTVLDHPGQLARLRANAEAAGVAARLTTVPIDLLDHSLAFPTGFDLVWMSQFLDCFGEADILALIHRGIAALGETGELAILESFWDRQPTDVGEVVVQGLSLYFTCIANGTSRMYHSNDFLELISRAGLTVTADEPVGSMHTLLRVRA